jgi:steroid delta-isomerase-like uncharacterized protein
MDADSNKDVIRRWFEVEWARADTAERANLYCDAGFVLHVGQAEVRGIEALREMVRGLKTAFPDLRITIEKMLAEGDLVAYHHQARGTHLGPYAGHPATGRPIVLRVTGILRLVDGRSVEGWESWDEAGLMRQLGLAG